MRVLALIASYNERRFIEPCLEHLERHGIDASLIDNCSTDDTVERAERWLGRNLIGIESFPRTADVYNWRRLLERKQNLARSLDADWFIHLDADELRLPPAPGQTLADALADVDREGYNAVNFAELTFIPTLEEPGHDHPEFHRTLRTYYPFSPRAHHQVKAWKAHPEVDLVSTGGHRVAFPGQAIYPEQFLMKHYLFLSVPHAIEKYVGRRYHPDEVASGWHGWRATITKKDFRLPARSEIRITRSDEDLDPAEPRKTHYVDTQLTS